MKWYNVTKYKPPMETPCLVMTKSNYYYLAELISPDDYHTWSYDLSCEECGCARERVFGVTHFMIPSPVEIEE